MMLRKMLSMATVFLFILTASAAAQLRVGYMSTDDVLSKLPARKQAQTKLNTLIQQKQNQLQKKSQAYQQDLSKFQKNKSTMSDQQKQQEQKKLSAEQDSLNSYNQQARAQIQQRRSELLSPILDKVDSAIAVVAKKHNLDFVLNKSVDNGDKVIYFAADSSLDITQEVLNELK